MTGIACIYYMFTRLFKAVYDTGTKEINKYFNGSQSQRCEESESGLVLCNSDGIHLLRVFEGDPNGVH